MSAEGLVFSAVSKRFGEQKVLDRVTLRISFGEVCALLGCNGAGKSTLIHLALGQLEADEGFVTIGGLRVDEEPLETKARLAYVPEVARFHDDLSAVETLQFFENLMGRRRGPAPCLEVLAAAGLDAGAAVRPVATFSKGMRQRLSIALGLLKGADVFLLDEPTSGLDPASARQLIGTLRALAHQGKAVCFSSHDIHSVLLAADRVALLENGRITSQETVREYRDRLSNLPLAASHA